jgi:glycerol uptake facilitator-like aquaporin
MNKKYLTEFLGTAALLSVITGSGLMGQVLSSGNDAVHFLVIVLLQALGFMY